MIHTAVLDGESFSWRQGTPPPLSLATRPPYVYTFPIGDQKKVDLILEILKNGTHSLFFSALFLIDGHYLPNSIKTILRSDHTFFAGFCDEAGNSVDRTQYTHVGWVLVPHVP